MAITLRDVSLTGQGTSISLALEAGQTLAVVGPSASGKTKLLRAIAGLESPARGAVSKSGAATIPEPANRKLKLQDLSHRRGTNLAAMATEVLSQLGLWDCRQQIISELSPAQIAACDLVETFINKSPIILLDEHLDRLDPWAGRGALRLIRGHTCVAVTNNLDLVTQFDSVVVLKAGQPLYAGSVADLIRMRGERSLTIESERSVGVRALVDPLLVGVARTDGGYKLQPGPGQEHTAKLLRDGYGDVKFLVSDRRNVAEIILDLVAA